MSGFRVQLDVFRGPLDLLLYLVRKSEVEIVEIPVAAITHQFLEHLEVLQVLDVNDVGEFLEMASTLLEIKSRMVLPRGGEEAETLEDPREALVERLLEYKKYRDGASMLDERSRQWQDHLPRLANDAPSRRIDPAGQPVQELELWDLVSAFGRVVRDARIAEPSNIVYDETPIHVYMEQIRGLLQRQGRVSFSEMFVAGMHKSAMIGVFLAVLELVRHHSVRTDQSELHGEIWILPGEQFEEELDAARVDQYGSRAPGLESPAETLGPARKPR